MSPSGRILGVLIVLGCDTEENSATVSLAENQDQRVTTVIEGCESWTGEHKEWCALQAMGSKELSGSLVASVCERMETVEVVDQCWEMAVRQGNAPGAEELCTRIDGALLRDSCHLTAVIRDLPLNDDPTKEVLLNDLLELCDRTGGLRSECAVHILDSRLNIWSASLNERHEHMTHEVRQMVMSWYPPLQEDRDFGMAIGFAAAKLNLDLGKNGACEVFPYGPPKLACIYSAHEER